VKSQFPACGFCAIGVGQPASCASIDR
jgi:hypothetical protein